MTVVPPSSDPLPSLPAQPEGVPFPTVEWPEGPAPDAIADRLHARVHQVFDPETLDTAAERMGQSLAFVAVHRGRIVAEAYGPTAGPDEQLISWSMAKSITHALTGVLVGEDRLRLDAPIGFDEWSDPEDPRSSITLDHLLRMVPGTEFNEDYVDAQTSHCIEMLFGDGKTDMGAYTAALPSIAPADTVFNYSSGTTVLVCRALAEQVGGGDDFAAWAEQVLFRPIGMQPRLTFDEVGTWVGSSFLHATARDFARFGLLYARDGVWDGARLVPEGWVDYARTPRAANEEGTRYGAQWWIWPPTDGVFYAAGYETQRIIVDPVSDLVLVRLGKTPTELAEHVDAWLEGIRLLFRNG
ncbi:MAG: serine hydrolase [Actinomycetota bacterium]